MRSGGLAVFAGAAALSHVGFDVVWPRDARCTRSLLALSRCLRDNKKCASGLTRCEPPGALCDRNFGHGARSPTGHQLVRICPPRASLRAAKEVETRDSGLPSTKSLHPSPTSAAFLTQIRPTKPTAAIPLGAARRPPCRGAL